MLINLRTLLVSTILACVVLCTTTRINAQNSYVSLTGIVTDTKNDAPIEGATVYIPEFRLGTMTNALGEYHLSVPSVDKYDLHLSLIGYENKIISIERANRTSITLNILLTPISEQLAEVVVIGKSKEQRMREVPSTITVLDKKDLQGQVSSLNDVLNRAMGVKVAEKGGMGSVSRMMIQGLDGKRIAIFVNGMPYGSSEQANLSAIPIDRIEAVEIYKGVVPAWLGGDGLGGAVNVILKQMSGDHIKFAYEIGSFNTHKADIQASKSLEKAGIDVTLGGTLIQSDNNYIFKSPFEDDLIIKRDHDKYRSYGADLSIGFTKLWFDHIGLSIGFQHIYQQIQGGLQHIQQNVQYAHNNIDSWQGGLSLNKSLLDNDLEMSLNTMLSRSIINHVDTSRWCYNFLGERYPSSNGMGEISYPNDSHDKYTTIQSVLNLSYKLSQNNRLLLNISYQYSRKDPRDDVAESFTKFPINFMPNKLHFLSSGLTHELKLLDESLTNELSGKFFFYKSEVFPVGFTIYPNNILESNKNKKSTWGGSEAIAWKPIDNFTAKASVQYTFRTPRAEELFGNGVLIFANEKLQPEQSFNVNIGLNWLINNRSYPNARVDINAYWMNVTDMIKLTTASSMSMKHINYGKVRILGAEAGVYTELLPWLAMRASITYQDSRDRTQVQVGGGENFHYNYRVPNMPYFFGNAELRFSQRDLFTKDAQSSLFVAGDFTENFYYNWTLSKDSNLEIPRRWNLNAGVQQSFKDRYHLSFEVHNLLNSEQWAEYKYPLPGRSFHGKIKITL